MGDLFERGGRVGPYRVVSRIGGGAATDVYTAQREVEDDLVALKCLNLPRIASSEGSATRDEAFLRFRQEIAVLYAAECPSIVEVTDFDLKSDPPYYAMPLARGDLSTLDALSPEADEAQLRERLTLYLSISGAVRCLHRQKRLHRDIKAQNVLVYPGPTVRLADFGLVGPAELAAGRDSVAGDPRITRGRLFAGGAPEVWAPEMLRRVLGREAGEVHTLDTEVYALGRILHFLIVGGAALPSSGVKLSFRRIRRIRLNHLESIMEKALHEDPGRRFRTPRGLEAAVCSWILGKPIHDAEGLLAQHLQQILRNRTPRPARQKRSRTEMLLLASHPGMSPNALVTVWEPVLRVGIIPLFGDYPWLAMKALESVMTACEKCRLMPTMDWERQVTEFFDEELSDDLRCQRLDRADEQEAQRQIRRLRDPLRRLRAT